MNRAGIVKSPLSETNKRTRPRVLPTSSSESISPANFLRKGRMIDGNEEEESESEGVSSADLSRPGSLVWAKVRGYPWWPGRVLSDGQTPDELIDSLRQNKRFGSSSTDIVAVFFFGSHDHSLVAVDSLRSLNENWSELSKKSNASRFKMALREAQRVRNSNDGLKLSLESSAPRKRGRPPKSSTTPNSNSSMESSLDSITKRRPVGRPPKRPIKTSIRNIKLDKDSGTASIAYLRYCRVKLQKILLRPVIKSGELPVALKILQDLQKTPISIPSLHATNISRVLRLALQRSDQQSSQTERIRGVISAVLEDWRGTLCEFVAQVGL